MKNAKTGRLTLFLPLLAAVFLLALDQISKALVASKIPVGAIAWTWGGDFFWLVHARNLGVAFSIGYGLADNVRRILFVVLPLALVAGALVYYFKAKELTLTQRWALAILTAGGAGNLTDRIFRPDGVVDFLSFKFFGIMGMARWPTFNVADMCVVSGAVLLALSGFLTVPHGVKSDVVKNDDVKSDEAAPGEEP